MASPCEILIETEDYDLVRHVGELAQNEAHRIEAKFSRYRQDSILTKINTSKGATINMDSETAMLIGFAQQCHALSGGLFDVTSGILRRAWKFDGSARLPDPSAIQALLPFIGFEMLKWEPPSLTVPQGMELDFGGIGKEYAVDCVLQLLTAHFDLPILVNFGGDLRTNRCPARNAWQVGIERPDSVDNAALVLELSSGALATSGDARRFLIKDGHRYGHILNPATGWPVPNAPRSVTVAASTCLEAGMLATLSLLQGAKAREFLDAQQAVYWCLD